ncbi:hypothetical protein ASD00_33760 [Ensifer sp. Root31]|uniref:serine hydrolase domain-containing protein n=1 Tax=Ensifer sp. Root31 TaxID=1736512 RepID=UPI000715A142|nr:serine hydrolase domain-containing protein [Ensifer sp. Root31]KQU83872.1 hypothetical protein ASD00_33760 [Ensifer sp. Root31]
MPNRVVSVIQLAVLCTALSTGVAKADHMPPQEALLEAAEAIKHALRTSSVPGMVIGVSDHKQLRSVIVHGYADLKTKTPVSQDTTFAIGSIGKSMTSIALLQLMEQGRYDPSLPVSKYLPWFSVKSSFGPITGHHLLTHTAGLPDDNLYSDSPAGPFLLRDYELPYAPGSHHSYSNVGYQTLGFTLEAIESAPYYSILAKHVFGPLGMTSSHGRIDDTQRGIIAQSYKQSPVDDGLVEAGWFEYSAGDGGVVSTVDDLSTYARFILNRGETPGGRLLEEKTFSLFTTPALDGYAYGIEVRKSGNQVIYEHTGSISGYRANLEAHMDEGYAVVTLRNGPIEAELNQWILDTIQAAFHGEAPKAPPVTDARKSISRYAGAYRNASGRVLRFVMVGDKLALMQGDEKIVMKRFAPGMFTGQIGQDVNTPFVFGLASDYANSEVTDVAYGSEWYVKEDRGRLAVETPVEFKPFIGRYDALRSDSAPIRIYARNGNLVANVDDEVILLLPHGDGAFQPAEPAFNPERYKFDKIVNGRALELNISGLPTYRIETP